MPTPTPAKKHFLVASDFDQTLSFNDSGVVLSELIGASSFQEKVAGLAASNLVHQGGELAYLIRHIPRFMEFLDRGLDDHRFSFFVISAAPREVVLSALEGIVPADHIFGTELDYDPRSGEVRSIRRVPAGYGKVSVLEELEARLATGPDRTIYVGDGSSDVHVMLHVNNRDGFTIAVSENKHLARIAKSTVLSDSAFSVVLPMLRQVFGWGSSEIRTLFESYGLTLQEWDKACTDRITLGLPEPLDGAVA